MAKKVLIAALALLFLISMTACDPLGDLVKKPTPTQPVAQAPTSAEPGTGPTRAVTEVVLATPTPLPPPPTPTPIPPTETPTPEPPTPTSEAQETDAPDVTREPTNTPEPTATPDPKSLVTEAMVEIPAGEFSMGVDPGDTKNGPLHVVDLPAFEIDRFEVTNGDYALFAEATGYQTYMEQQGYRSWRDLWGAGEDRHPVVIMTWDDASAYCEWLGKRLPTEAEWEKAARGTDGRTYPWGNDWDPSKANVKERGLRGTSAVGSFPAGASPFGVDDMAGNVWEWTSDWFQPYPGSTAGNPYFGEKFRVTRGGGWFDDETLVNTFNRNAADPAVTANDDLGFRCAR
jgi:formylglycine-generating enzyme required for sulfatase activity